MITVSLSTDTRYFIDDSVTGSPCSEEPGGPILDDSLETSADYTDSPCSAVTADETDESFLDYHSGSTTELPLLSDRTECVIKNSEEVCHFIGFICCSVIA